MPKKTEEQKKKRSHAIQNGYKTAVLVPLDTARNCTQILDAAKIIAEIGNVNSITDTAVSAIMARSAIESAILNVKINLSSIKDEDFVNKTNKELETIQKNVTYNIQEILKIVNSKM